MFPLLFVVVPTVSVNSVPVVVAVPVVTLAVIRFPDPPVPFEIVGDDPAAAPAAGVFVKPLMAEVCR